jgi:heme exporter protein A
MRLVAENLACVRSGRAVFAGLSFALDAGEALVVTGPNGAGKSSLLRLLAGLIEPAGGTLRLDGASDERTLPEEAHYVGHRDALKATLTPRESLEFWRDMLGRPRLDPETALETMGLGHAVDLPGAYLSAGQRRRLALSRLLVSGRPVWLLDEPTSALDTASQALFADLVRAHLAGGGLVVAATHLPLGFEGARTLDLGGRTS